MWGQRKRKSSTGLVGLNLHDNGFSLASIDKNAKQELRLQRCSHHSIDNPEHFAKLLPSIVKEQQLIGKICAWVMQPRDYQTYLIDALDVPADELHAAVRWRVKDYLEYPLEEAVIDVCTVHNHAPSRQNDQLFVIAARRNILESTIKTVQAAGLDIKYIDITELALRNVMTFYTEHSRECALIRLDPIHLDPFSGHMLIMHDYELQLIRHIEMDLSPLTDGIVSESRQQLSENLLLEIQRTYDYCVSQLGLNIPTKLLLGPRIKQEEDMVNLLRQQLTSQVEVVDMTTIMGCDETLSFDLQNHCMAAIGGALRIATEQNFEVKPDAAN